MSVFQKFSIFEKNRLKSSKLMLRVIKWWEIDKLKIFFEILKVWVILSLMVAWIVFISKIHESMVIWSCNITFWRQIFGKTGFFLFFLLFWPKSSNINKCWVLWQILLQIFSWDPKVPCLQILLSQNSFWRQKNILN